MDTFFHSLSLKMVFEDLISGLEYGLADELLDNLQLTPDDGKLPISQQSHLSSIDLFFSGFHRWDTRTN